TPPYLAKGVVSSVGLMIAVALSPTYCSGLPFTLEAVEETIPLVAQPHVTLEWHAEDDIVPGCRADPQCVLRAENIGRWLGAEGPSRHGGPLPLFRGRALSAEAFATVELRPRRVEIGGCLEVQPELGGAAKRKRVWVSVQLHQTALDRSGYRLGAVAGPH